MIPIAILYFMVCLTIAYFGRHRKLGFWGYLFGSLLLSPLIGLLLLFASDVRKPKPVR